MSEQYKSKLLGELKAGKVVFDTIIADRARKILQLGDRTSLQSAVRNGIIHGFVGGIVYNFTQDGFITAAVTGTTVSADLGLRGIEVFEQIRNRTELILARTSAAEVNANIFAIEKESELQTAETINAASSSLAKVSERLGEMEGVTRSVEARRARAEKERNELLEKEASVDRVLAGINSSGDSVWSPHFIVDWKKLLHTNGYGNVAALGHIIIRLRAVEEVRKDHPAISMKTEEIRKELEKELDVIKNKRT